MNDTSVNDVVSSAMQSANADSDAAASTAGAVHVIQVQGNTLNIQLSNEHTTQDCANGRLVKINGYQNDITLTGTCSRIVLNGWSNTVHTDRVNSIEILGHTNTLYWLHGSKPVAELSGADNAVHHITD